MVVIIVRLEKALAFGGRDSTALRVCARFLLGGTPATKY
jgi:hypothetical protein